MMPIRAALLELFDMLEDGVGCRAQKSPRDFRTPPLTSNSQLLSICYNHKAYFHALHSGNPGSSRSGPVI